MTSYFFSILLCLASIAAGFSDGYLSEPILQYGVFTPNATVSFGNPFPLAATSQFTVSLWIKRGGCSSTTANKLLVLSCKSAFSLFFQASTMYFTVTSLTSTPGSSTALCDQYPARWANIAAVFSGSALKIYFNGALDGTTGSTSSGSRVMGDSSQLCFLGNDGYSYGVTAWMRHVYISSVAKGASEILSGLNSAPSYSGSLLVYLPMDAGNVADKYRMGVVSTANSVFSYGKSNEPEFICHCTGNCFKS